MNRVGSRPLVEGTWAQKESPVLGPRRVHVCAAVSLSGRHIRLAELLCDVW